LFVGSLDGSVSERVVSTSWAGVYINPGHVLYLRDGVLMAQEFNERSAVLRSEAVPVAEFVGGRRPRCQGFLRLVLGLWHIQAFSWIPRASSGTIDAVW
jgi:hypothetical protein